MFKQYKKTAIELACALIFISGISLTGCKDATMPEPLFKTDLTSNGYVPGDAPFIDPENVDELIARDKELPYYKNLRAWKERDDHEVAFGYFGNWVGKGLTYENSLRGMPDSVHFVSLWGGWANLDAATKADLRYAQEVKGLKALACVLLFEIGDGITPALPKELDDQGVTWLQWKHRYWGWDIEQDGEWISNEETIRAAIIKYANAFADSIFANGVDGLDIDAEPSYAQPFATTYEMWRPSSRMDLFVETISKRIGPKAETEEGRKKILAIDGEPHAISAEYGDCFNYFILQAYGDSSPSSIQSRYAAQVRHFSSKLNAEEVAKRIIYVSNFENYAQTGGPAYQGDPQLIWFAKFSPEWDGVKYRKGGVGSYHMEYEYNVASHPETTYPYLRKAIQIMTPAIH